MAIHFLPGTITSMKYLIYAFALLLFCTAKAQETPFVVATQSWNADSLGNHRAVISVIQQAQAVQVKLPWRRRDQHPELKRIIVQDGQSGARIRNVKFIAVNREAGELVFEPVSGAGTYYIYYLPMRNEGRSNYPRGVYLKPDTTAAAEWLNQLPATPAAATVLQFESINQLHSLYPMEIIATAAEKAALLQQHQSPFLIFPEERNYPIIMTGDLPYRWVKKGPQQQITGTADRGEWFAFQIGLYAQQATGPVVIRFSKLTGPKGTSIPSGKLTCINLEGTTYDAKPLKKTVTVDAGKVQAFWCGLDVPEQALPGVYKGTAVVETTTGKQTLQLEFTITPALATAHGEDEPWKQTRLKWLNSTLAQQNTVIAPYTPLKVEKNRISMLGRTLVIGKDGLPEQIETYFTPEMTELQKLPNVILNAPMQFRIKAATGNVLTFKNTGQWTMASNPGTVKWSTVNRSEALDMKVNASLEFDGFAYYTVKLIARKDITLDDIALEMPFSKAAATYMMGLGQKGGYRPENFNWKWEVATKNQDGAWIGAVNAGLQYSLRDESYVRPLNTNFYLQKPLLLPKSWGNENKGGITITEQAETVLINNYSGSRSLQAGDSLFFNFTLLITPFHTLQTDFQWDARFFHSYKPVDTVKAAGASIINIHHANAINPWINYPFIEHAKMKAYIDSAHALGLKVKIYNTVRELSNHAYETFPLRSLGHEIYSTGKGGGYSWLQEHVGEDYIAAWFVPEIKDAAIVNSGMNRWHNYYVEGMNWLTSHVGIDGIYLDDVAFDRITMKRIKRVLTKNGHPGIIDLHSANQYNKNDGFNNSANLYMEHFPYLNKLWFGEYFDYEKGSPDFYLTEVSGIPFGLMGEMLEGGGNPYRGMIYGMTNRMPWSAQADPRPLWQLWNDFGMKSSEMIGYWSENCPAKPDHPAVKATVYRRKEGALIAIASWAEQDIVVNIPINWKQLGIDPAKASVILPEIKGFQEGDSLRQKDGVVQLEIRKGKGAIIWVKAQ